MSRSDTIFGVASGAGVSAVCVLRVSGPECQRIIERVFERPLVPRQASLRWFLDPGVGSCLDQVISIWFPGPDSFTGEDCLEIHSHGSIAVRTALMAALGRFENCRLAERGEFTLRAFENGKMDLGAVEGLADLLDARTERQRSRAMDLLAGGISAFASDWRRDVLALMAEVTASIDFSDEESVESLDFNDIARRCDAIAADMTAVLTASSNSEIVRAGFDIVICGRVNAGKSSLLNSLAKRDVAIVSDVPGTTRDANTIELSLDGFLVRVWDVAGLRGSDDMVESIGIERGISAALDADMVLWLWERGGDRRVDDRLRSIQDKIVFVETKIDKVDLDHVRESCDLGISCRTGVGIEALVLRLQKLVLERSSGSGDIVTASERQRQAISGACGALRRVSQISDGGGPELIAEELEVAALNIGRISGEIGVEDVLGDIFSRFCIGK